MASKLRIKIGHVELEFEGDTAIAVKDVETLLSQIQAISTTAPVPIATGENNNDQSVFHAGGNTPSPHSKLHVNSVAQKLDAKSGSEVALAAAAYLQFMEGKDTFSRAELLAAMKKATKYYKQNMNGNLTKIIDQLLNGKFNQIGDGQYSLTSGEYQALEAKLAQS